MNAKTLIAAVALIAAGSAFAEQTYPFVEHTGYASSTSRAAVAATVKADNAAALPGSTEFTDYTRVATEKSRAEVRAELGGGHEFQVARNPEFIDNTHFASVRTRDEVRREAVQSAKAASTVSGS
ncbi:DUF4148 domain-containing protein [Noviherbaspirillum galbum]|uniref:DUF4148 domain-containing protein n=1 Tax=Noviherbaspirillum galbum TaxID=2709383 RepID=A0A6B3SMC1_9BURK|nr:DUF4148 domain-containing protein [Noviherbaspirillum galbum]NEX59522.1 DUF4148 domain-containing protein [Noviherbaspirillum galbum]